MCFGYSSNLFASDNGLATCLVESMTGKERKVMAKWMFFAMAEHPEIKVYSKITTAEKDSVDSDMGRILVRLLTEDCLLQTKASIKLNGNNALYDAFGVVGKFAMQELTGDTSVSKAFSGYSKYIDKEKMKVLYTDDQGTIKNR